jgi:hypothetical protein
MKNQLFCLIGLVLLIFIACQPPAAVEEKESPDYAAFDKKVEILRSFLKAHCDENLAAQSEMLADTLKWSPPYYNGSEWLGKEEYIAALKNYHDGFENIKFDEGIVLADTTVNGMWSGSVFPEATATSDPVTIRIYGIWTATHSESGKDIGVKWFGLGSVNEAGEIHQFNEYFDVHGIAAQIAAE